MSSDHFSKLDSQLPVALRKATDPKECPPKPKHVRTCIVYTWERNKTTHFWNSIKGLPFLADEVQTFKLMVTLHAVLRQGSKQVTDDGVRECGWLRTIPSNLISKSHLGYSFCITSYVDFLIGKINYHNTYKAFNGTFDYQEYISLRAAADLNVGYEVVDGMLGLIELLHKLQQTVVSTFPKSPIVSCRVSSIVLIVRESYSIYRFMTSIMCALHHQVGSHDSLSYLRDRFKIAHKNLRAFYSFCRSNQNVLSMIVAPDLPAEPPRFTDLDETVMQRLAPLKDSEDTNTGTSSSLSASNSSRRPSGLNPLQQNGDESARGITSNVSRTTQNIQHTTSVVVAPAVSNDAAYQKAVAERDAQIALMEQQARMNAARYEAEMNGIKEYTAQLQHQLQAQMQQLQALNDTLATFAAERDVRALSMSDSSRLQAEYAQIKGKYDALSGVYSTLRKEHLELLAKSKEFEKYRQEVAALKAQLAGSKAANEQEMRAKEEEALILQAGMDQSLLALSRLKAKYETSQSADSNKLQDMQQRHVEQLDSIFDAIISECVRRVKQSGDVIGSEGACAQTNTGSSNSTSPEHTLALLESAVNDCNAFAESLQAHLVDPSAPENHQPQAIARASEFTISFSNIVNSLPSIIELCEKEGDAAGILGSARSCVQVIVRHLEGIKSRAMAPVEFAQRPHVAGGLHKDTILALGALASQIEAHLGREGGGRSALESGKQGAGGTANVESELIRAATAIADGTTRLQAMMAQREGGTIVDKKLQVHGAILESAMRLMQDTGNLVRAAAHCQQEIVSHDRNAGNSPTSVSSSSTFYKKNHRWSQGLISAGKAIAAVAVLLVETSDGVVGGKRSFEELMVAAKEVATATTQLVAASRVKQVPGSKRQPELESCASRVTRSSQELVATALAASQQRDEKEADGDSKRLAGMTTHDIKTQEMDQQVAILTLEKELVLARRKLAQMRKHGYHMAGGDEGMM